MKAGLLTFGGGKRWLQEWIQPVLILLSLAFAYTMPFEGVLLSYAILGPIHYLTQISWMHDRGYFFRDKFSRRIFVAAALLLTTWLAVPVFFPALYRYNHYGMAFATLLVFVLPLFLGMSSPRRVQFALFLGMALLVWGLLHFDFFVLFGGVLLTTIIHVSIFTFAFLCLGARKTRNPISITAVVMWLLAVLFIVLMPPEVIVYFPENFASQSRIFDEVATAMGANAAHRLDASWAAAYGLLTFCYTYHYINWFTKTELLQWHKIPPARWLVIIILYLLALMLYLQDYWTALKIFVFLSGLHVFLEFPLNVQTFRALLSRSAPAGK